MSDVRNDWSKLFKVNANNENLNFTPTVANENKNQRKSRAKRRPKISNVPVTSGESAGCKVVFTENYCKGNKSERRCLHNAEKISSSDHYDMTGVVETRPGVKFSKKDLDLDQLRHEVRRYGIAGYSGDQKESAEINMIIKLGGRPPKKDCVNYKELQERLKAEKEAELQRQEDFNIQMSSVLSKKKRQSRQRMKTIGKKFTKIKIKKKVTVTRSGFGAKGGSKVQRSNR